MANKKLFNHKNNNQNMKKVFLSPITYCLLFVACIFALSSYQTKDNSPAPFIKILPSERDSLYNRLVSAYENVMKIECIKVSEQRDILKDIALCVNYLRSLKADSTQIKN